MKTQFAMQNNTKKLLGDCGDNDPEILGSKSSFNAMETNVRVGNKNIQATFSKASEPLYLV